MKFSGLCNPSEKPPDLVEVWLEAGREGRTFTYSADAALGLQAGDLVRVRLRGRPLHGLVVARYNVSLGATVPDKVQAVEGLVQQAAVAWCSELPLPPSGASGLRVWLNAAISVCSGC